MLLISFVDGAIGAIEDALTSLQGLAMGFPSLIVQSTQGQNFNLATKEYTHAVVTRFRSREPSFPLTIYLCSDSVPPSFCLPLLTGFFFLVAEALEIFEGSSDYKHVRSKIYLFPLIWDSTFISMNLVKQIKIYVAFLFPSLL